MSGPARAELVRSGRRRDGARLVHRRRPGDGDPVLFLPGSCADHRAFLPLVERLPGRDLVLPDLRAQGESTRGEHSRVSLDDHRRDVIDLLDVEKIGRAWIVAHSWGAALAQRVFETHPERVAGLALVGAHDLHRPAGRGERVRVAVTTGLVKTVPWKIFSGLSGWAVTSDPGLRRQVAADHVAAGRGTFLELGHVVLAGQRAFEDYGDLPLLLVRGERDLPRYLGPLHETMARRSTRSRVIVIPGAGHLCHQERLDVVAAHLNTWWR